MTGYLVVPTLTALTAENQPFEQFWAASCESWAKAHLAAIANCEFLELCPLESEAIHEPISMPQRLHDLLGHLLGVAEQHHRVRPEEQLVVHARIA